MWFRVVHVRIGYDMGVVGSPHGRKVDAMIARVIVTFTLVLVGLARLFVRKGD